MSFFNHMLLINPTINPTGFMNHLFKSDKEDKVQEGDSFAVKLLVEEQKNQKKEAKPIDTSSYQKGVQIEGTKIDIGNTKQAGIKIDIGSPRNNEEKRTGANIQSDINRSYIERPIELAKVTPTFTEIEDLETIKAEEEKWLSSRGKAVSTEKSQFNDTKTIYEDGSEEINSAYPSGIIYSTLINLKNGNSIVKDLNHDKSVFLKQNIE